MSITLNKIKVGIVGGSGYTGGELIRLITNHPKSKLIFVHSNVNSGIYISDIHQDLIGETDIKFQSKLNYDIDVLFLCLGHGKSNEFLNNNNIKQEIKVIDLSQDYRLENSFYNKNFDEKKNFVYGLPELKKEKIKNAQNIANPGCFATAIQLGLLPLIGTDYIDGEIHTNAITGSTGAGVIPSDTSHFSWRNNNISCYKTFTHQHLEEIYYSFNNLSKNTKEINFLPVRGGFTRGIFCTSYFDSKIDLNKAKDIYTNFYKKHPFIIISEKEIHLKQVINTNKCIIHITMNKNKLLITSIIDNLIKGASGQAIQNMNLMFGIDEQTGLKLKSSIF